MWEGGLLVVLFVAAGSFWIFGWESGGWRNIILLSAVIIAALSLRASRRTERQKATLLFLQKYHESDIIARGVAVLNGLKDNHPPLEGDDRVAVRDFLNQLELLAVGLRSGIYDEKMVCDTMETAIVRYYRRGQNFIRQCRISDGDVREVAYEHFERLGARLSQRLKKP